MPTTATPKGVKYRKGYGPVTFTNPTTGVSVEAHKRADGTWGWTKRAANGRKIGTNGQGLQRVRACSAARVEAGPGAVPVDTWVGDLRFSVQ